MFQLKVNELEQKLREAQIRVHELEAKNIKSRSSGKSRGGKGNLSM